MVHVKRAKALMAGDTGFLESGMSDPYVVVVLGKQACDTPDSHERPERGPRQRASPCACVTVQMSLHSEQVPVQVSMFSYSVKRVPVQVSVSAPRPRPERPMSTHDCS